MDGRRKCKRGYTLIECIAYIFISSLLTMMIVNTTIEVYKYGVIRTEMINREDSIDNAILNIRRIFNEIDNTTYIVNNNRVEIIKEHEKKEQVDNENTIDVNIKLKEFEIVDGNLRVKYYSINKGNKELKTSNLILEDVKEFNIYAKKNLLYAELKVDEREYFICL